MEEAWHWGSNWRCMCNERLLPWVHLWQECFGIWSHHCNWAWIAVWINGGKKMQLRLVLSVWKFSSALYLPDNQRMVEGGRDCWSLYSPSPLLRGLVRTGSPGLCQVGFWILLRIETSLGYLCQCLTTVTIKNQLFCGAGSPWPWCLCSF